MKKVAVVAAVALAVGFTAPQVASANEIENQPRVEVASQEVAYELIDQGELPVAISEAIASGYTGYTIEEAYKGDDGSYKVVLKNEDSKMKLFYTAAGELTKVEKA